MRPGSLRRTLALAKWPFGEADRLDPPRVPDHVIVFGEAHLSIAMSFDRICPHRQEFAAPLSDPTFRLYHRSAATRRPTSPILPDAGFYRDRHLARHGIRGGSWLLL